MGLMDDEFVRVTSDLERAGSVLSLFGSFFIIVTFSCFPAFQKKPINRLVFFASFGNIVANAATLMAGRYVDNPGSVGCQLQGAMIQMYMPADAFWALAMAINVWLTFYRKWDSRELRKMEWRYLCLCYGVPFVPALIFIFISSPSRGRVYGDARLWCWVTESWAPLRFGVFYGPVWVAILITFFIYVRAGRELYATRKKLQEFSTGTTSIPDSEYFSMADPYSAKANEVVASREPTYDALNSPGGRGTAWGRSSRPGRGQGQTVGEFPVITGVSQPTTPGGYPSGYPSKKSLDANSAAAAAAAAEIGAKTQTFDFSLGAPTCPNAAKAGGESPTGLQGRRARAPTNINLSGLAPPSMLDTPLASPASFVNTLRPVSTNDTRRRDQFRSMLKFQRSSRASALAANSAAWSYTKCAMLFFTAMCITWIPSSANRIYNLASGGQTSPVLLYMTSIVLPIQGFWNCVIYCVTSREAVKLMLSDLWDVVGSWICCGRARRRMRGQQALADEQEQQQQQQLQFQQLQQYQQFQFEFQQQQQRQQQQQGGGGAGTGGGGQQHALQEISEHDSDEHPDWQLVTPPRRSFQTTSQQTTVSGQKTKVQPFVMLSPPIEDLDGQHHNNKHELMPSGSGSGRGGDADDEDDEHEEEEEGEGEDENRGRDRKCRSTRRGDISATTSTTRLTNSSASPEPPPAQGSSTSTSKSVHSR